jgi:hypothetical protein
MFGLEDDKKAPKGQEFSYELEKDLKNSAQRKEIQTHVEQQIQKIKDILRGGDTKEEFDQFGLLLQGYESLLKVIARVKI